MGLQIKPCDRLALYGFSDTGWPGTSDDRRSIASYCVYFGDTLLSWSSKKQQVISISNTESEY